MSPGIEFKRDGLEFIHVASPRPESGARGGGNGRDSPLAKRTLLLVVTGRIQVSSPF